MKKIDERIFKALEENKNNKLNDLVGGFMSIVIGTIIISEFSKQLK